MAGHGIWERLHPMGPYGNGTARLNSHAFQALILAILGEGGFGGSLNARKIKIRDTFNAFIEGDDLADGQPWGDELADAEAMVDYAAALLTENDRLKYALGLTAACNLTVQGTGQDQTPVYGYDDWVNAANIPPTNVEGWTRPGGSP